MDDVNCTGSESRIEDCPYNEHDNCGYNEGAGVICVPKGKQEIYNCTLWLKLFVTNAILAINYLNV